ncbi:AraC family transcriptional regulator [Kineococcus terrestris]|uniref:AraC family transcriptional regulator n=1 Tax=Kineococcus terrestris TaxID=2044856 RepID=UPI0034DB7A38
MEHLAAALDGPRARGAFVLQVVMSAPWSVRVLDEAPLSVVALTAGSAWATTASGSVPMAPGDVLLVRGTEEYVLADSPGAAPRAVIGAGQSCAAADGRDLAPWTRGVRTWGNDPAGPDRLVVGTFRSRGEVGRVLLATLPGAVVVPGPDPDLLALLAREVQREAAGQEGVLDRLLDLLLVAALRALPAAAGAGPAGTVTDPAVRAVLDLVHADPARAWTVELLARRAGLSRSALTRRFTAAVGVPPTTWLTHARLALGADLLLADPERTLAGVAREVGYATPFSFSAAFARRYGTSPSAYRAGRGRGTPGPR